MLKNEIEIVVIRKAEKEKINRLTIDSYIYI